MTGPVSDLNSQIEAAKEKVATLQQAVEKSQKAKRDATLQSSLPAAVAASSGEWQPGVLRAPPATRVRRTLKGHFGKVTAVHWAGDSRHLVSASQDGNLLIWNAATANKVQAIQLKSSYVMSVGFEQKNDNLVACGGLDNLCTVYSRSQPNESVEMASHNGFLSCCRFLSEQEIVTSSGDSTCIHWDITQAKPISTFSEHTADAMFLALKPGDKNVFASCSVDKTAKIWDIRSPSSSVQTYGGHLGDVNGVEFFPSDGNCFATCSQDGTVRVFDTRAYNELTRFSNPSPANESMESEGFTCLAVSKSGRIVFCGHTDGCVHAYDVLSEKGPAFIIKDAHERHISCLGVSPQGNALCTGSWDTNIKIWA